VEEIEEEHDEEDEEGYYDDDFEEGHSVIDVTTDPHKLYRCIRISVYLVYFCFFASLAIDEKGACNEIPREDSLTEKVSEESANSCIK
jgi:hypothetical protein